MSVGNRRRGIRASIARRALAQAVRLLEPLETRQLLTTVSGISPGILSIGVAVDPPISVTFGSAMNSTSINGNTFEVFDSSNNLVAGRISYNAVDLTATFNNTSPLAYGATYHVVVVGGAGGVLDSGNGTLASNVSFSFTTAPNPASGTAGGGPILVITSTSNAFSSYYPEILRAEGFNEFSTVDISSVTATMLSSYSVVLLSQMSLTSPQVTTITNWVTNGGNLIAFRPDAQLATLLGLSAPSGTLSNAYLDINTTTGPGVGITGTTMQYHGTADSYSVNGATVVATLYSNSTASTSNPAVTVRNVGTHGGQAAAFTFDLAQSVIETRQGNPAWSGQERDGLAVTRPDDLFFGNSASDPEPNWVDLSKIQIPQADEEQRLLGNMITQMEADVMPLPKLWYLPNGADAVIVMTGDDHDEIYSQRNTSNAFNYYLSQGSSGGQPILASSYMFTGSITDAQAAQYAAQGFEVALHTEVEDSSGNATNWTSMAQLASIYGTETAAFEAAYPSLAAPRTNRMHGVVWSDYDSLPQVEYANGVRLDTTYYYWPGNWTGNNPGFFTGSGLPQLYATASGQVIDVFQAATQLTDENSAAQWSQWLNTLLGNATGPQGYYGAFTVNAHADTPLLPADFVPQQIIAAARQYNVPIITADELLNFEDGRDGSYFSNLSWNASASTMSFSMSLADQASGLKGMLPLLSNSGKAISSITLNGSAVPFTVQTIKGIAYAFFNAGAGNFVAQYSSDVTPPTVTNTTPANSATSVLISAAPSATFSEDVQASSIVFTLKNASTNAAIQGTAVYNSATHTVTFTPNEALSPNVTYTASVSGALDDSANAMAGTTTWSFTTSSVTNNLTVFPAASTPTVVDATDNQSINVGMKFQSTVPGQVTGIRFYKGTTNTGTHVGSLWTSTGQLLGSVTFTGETASGWQQANFSSPITINPNTTYVVSYLAPVGSYADDATYFATSGVNSGYLTGLADGQDGPDGVYEYASTSVFPNENNGSGSNYWVDVVFNAVAPNDSNAPAITSSTPASGATGVVTNSSITASFNQVVKSDGTLSISLKNGTTSVSGSLSYNATTRTATFSPSAPLVPGVTYTVTVNAASLLGTAMAPVTWSFTTAPANIYTLWSNSTLPSQIDSGDPTSVDVGTKFQSLTSGYVTGLKFYKASTNTGTHVGQLWDSNGNLLASVTFTNESASGWQTATFSAPVFITGSATYTVSYTDPNGHYSDTAGYFYNQFATNGPIEAAIQGDVAGNGVYALGSAFPNQTFNGSNYWVDPIYSTLNPGDTTPPTITARTPASGATGVSTTTSINVTFSEAVLSNSSLSIVLKQGATVIPGTLSYNAATFTATFTPTSTLSLSTGYSVTVGATDLAGNVMTPASWSFTTASSNSSSLWGGSVTPAVTSVGSATAVEVGVKFQSNVSGWVTGVSFYKGSGNTGTHVGHLWSSTGTLLATVTFSGESASGWQTASFSNPVAITANTTYVVSYFAPNGNWSDNDSYFTSSGFTNGPLTALSNTAGGGNGVYTFGTGGGFPTQSFDASNYWVDVNFTTTPPVDNTPPSIVSQSPASGATNVSTSSAINVTFSEAVKSDSSLSIVLKQGATVIPGTLSYNAATFTATFTPTSTLALSTGYSVAVTATDLAGNVMTPASWSFTTASSNSSSLWGGSVTPSVTSVGSATAVEVGVKFQSNVSGWVTGVSFYKGSGNTGTHVGHLWSSTGTLLATVTFSGESASGWQTASFSNPVAITANTTYVVSYFAPNGNWSDNDSYFTSSGFTNGPLTALSNTAGGGNGVYTFGTGGGFPTQSFDASNYWVDVNFTTTPPVDNTPPSIVNQTPASGATNVATSSNISVTFSEAVKSDSSLSIVLKQGSTVIPGTLSYNAATFTATFTPTSALSLSTGYSVTVGATDLAGNAMTPVSWSFTTGASNTSSLWGGSVTPAVTSVGSATAVEVGVKFQSNVSGWVTGVSFYKGSGNTGTHVGHLWSSTGTLLATVTFSGESASGWQTASFSNPVAITANTTYVVSYFAPNGNWSDNDSYFTSSGFTNGPLTALSNTAGGGNGVYTFGTGGGFPTQSFDASNYWVDVNFTTTPPVDNTPPSIVNQTPASGATNVATSSGISVTFSEAVKSDSSLSIVLKQGSTVIPGTLSYNAATFTATFTPTSTLALSTGYSVAVTATDLAGNVMTPASWNFTTASTNAFSVFGGSGTPADLSDANTSPVELGMKFQSSTAGFITGISFYKGSGNTGTHVGHLWDSSGNLLATVTFTNETAGGWQTALLSTPVAISANTTYMVSYYSPNGGWSASFSYFTSGGVTNGPLTALSDASAGGNGSYRFGLGGGFPNSSFQGTNYWVDVLFQTSL